MPVTLVVNTVSTGGGTSFKLIGWNDLGMHCDDGKDYSVFGVLPPYNTIHTHLIYSAGKLVISPAGYTVTYQAINDPLTNTLNTTSVLKTNFWETHRRRWTRAYPHGTKIASARTLVWLRAHFRVEERTMRVHSSSRSGISGRATPPPSDGAPVQSLAALQRHSIQAAPSPPRPATAHGTTHVHPFGMVFGSTNTLAPYRFAYVSRISSSVMPCSTHFAISTRILTAISLWCCLTGSV